MSMILGVFVSPMKIPPSLCGIRVIREIRGQKNQPRITQISRKNHNESHFHPQWRAAGSWKLGGKTVKPNSPPSFHDPALATANENLLLGHRLRASIPGTIPRSGTRGFAIQGVPLRGTVPGARCEWISLVFS